MKYLLDTNLCGQIRTSLESKDKTIGPLDMMIAAHALALHLTVISNNIKEFSRIPKAGMLGGLMLRCCLTEAGPQVPL